VLDEALASLSENDREALLLRFYRALTVREVAATLGIATDAAQKRIDRATARLRSKLARRGVQTGGSLGTAMLAGFAADAQAATLPVSMLASKAIAAASPGGVISIGTLVGIISTMKTSSFVLPAISHPFQEPLSGGVLFCAGTLLDSGFFSLPHPFSGFPLLVSSGPCHAAGYDNGISMTRSM